MSITIIIDNSKYYLLVGCLGLEPRTNRLKAEYSTIELATLPKSNNNIDIRINHRLFNTKQILYRVFEAKKNIHTFLFLK